MIKLALGTVQFGLNYGINNQNGVPNDEELKSIFSIAKGAGIDVLDSAQGYGNAEKRIGELTSNEFNVISKFKHLANPFPFHSELKESIKKVGANSIYGYMAHDADALIENPGWWEGLQQAKFQGLVKKLGYSLYSVKQLESLLAQQMIPDIIQLPYNVLDRRFESYLSELVSMGAEIHIRSVYLQGLLQMDPVQIPNHLISFQPYLNKVREIANLNFLTVGQLCLKFVLQNSLINKVVIGVDNVDQLKENLDIVYMENLSDTVVNELRNIEVADQSLLNPTNWILKK
jgi:aryl-alcohol dehydrogenase-like predicted oxidoreductase